MKIRPLPLDRIDESPSNPRRIFDKDRLDELAKSIKARGVEQPIKVRPHKDDRFELVFGARRVRAAKIAGLKEIPALVENLKDDEVLEAQIVENSQREDVHPLEEADAYRALHTKYSRTAEEIAAKVGKTAGHIYQRMKLCQLGEEGRTAFYAGTIDAATALILARIPDPQMQGQATRDVVRGIAGQPLRATEARQLVRDRYMLVLARAPFSTSNAKLFEQAGACTACPKRTGNQPGLFGDLGKADLCTDPGCYTRKVEAQWERTTEAAQKASKRVISPSEARRLFVGTELAVSCGYFDLDAVDPSTVGEDATKRRTYRQTMKLKDVAVVVARDHEGHARELVEAQELRRACSAAGVVPPPIALGRAPKAPEAVPAVVATKPSKSAKDAEREAKDRAHAAKEFRVAVVGAVVSAADKDGGTEKFWRTMARGAVEIAHRETIQALQERRNVKKLDLEKMDRHALALVVLEVLVTQGALYSVGEALPPRIAQAAQDFGVDVKQVRKTLIAAAAQRRKG